ncbi:MAG: hypothetical protein EP343_07060 [Deltaproteobacteria bacterium]|nr:MAG: hypothetical protein EP343_07060 [Deltaproteobacteria bacterium]
MRTILKMTSVLSFTLAFLGVSWLGHADVVNPAPTSCPAGSTPSTGHVGPHCAPTTCQSNTDCKSGETCREISLCITTETGVHRGGSYTVEFAHGTCSGTCSKGTCQKAMRCASSSVLGCSQTGTMSGSILLSLLPFLLLFGLLWLRRIQQSGTSS